MPNLLLELSVLVGGVWLLSGIAFLLHHLSSRLGVALLLMYVSTLVGMLAYTDPLITFVEPLPNIVFTFPSDIFIPTILLIILLLYIYNGTPITQTTIIGLAVVQLLVALVFVFVSLSQSLPTADTRVPAEAIASIDYRIFLPSTITFIIDMLVITVVYQVLANTLNDAHVGAALGAITAALIADAIIFNLLLGIWAFQPLSLSLGDLLSKSIGAVILWPGLALYISWQKQDTQLSPVAQKRDALNILADMFHNLRQLNSQLEAELRESEMNNNQLILSIQEIFWIVDEDNSVHFISPAFESIIGISRGEVYMDPTKVDQMLHPENANDMRGHWLRYNPQPTERVFRLVRPDNSMIWLRDRTYPLVSEELNIRRIVGITEDITAYKINEQLRSDIATEQQKIRLLSKLAQDAAHDLHTPLTALSLKSDIIRLTRDDPAKQEHHLKQLQDQTKQLSDLIHHTFTLLSTTSNRPIRKKHHNLNVLCQEVTEMLRSDAADKHITLSVNLSEPGGEILCDPVLMRRVISNLVSNALRYTPHGGDVFVSTEALGHEVVLLVQDTGIGIPPQDLPKIFERFYRASNTGPINGNGLGLAITKEVINEHNGKINVSSEVGIGTVFTVRFPLIGSIPTT